MNKAVLQVAMRWESKRKAFFNRNSDNSMTIHVRDPRIWGGENHEHWQAARQIETEILAAKGKIFEGIRIDPQSGTLVIRIVGVYAE